MKRSLKLILGVVAALAIVTTAVLSVNAANHYPNTHTTTFFVHGYGSSYHAEQSMANYMVRHGASTSIIRANIADDGSVTFVGHQAKDAKNPIVEVNYNADNPRRDMNSYGTWLKNVVQADAQKYGTTKINLVGHSMGNIVIMSYLTDNLSDSTLPKVNHLVSLAGGVFPGYNQVDKLEQQLPSDLKVLNVYSNYRQGTDTRVPNKYSRRLRSVFKGRTHYREVELHGLTHSQIHESGKVDQILINFLFKDWIDFPGNNCHDWVHPVQWLMNKRMDLFAKPNKSTLFVLLLYMDLLVEIFGVRQALNFMLDVVEHIINHLNDVGVIKDVVYLVAFFVVAH